MHRCNTKKREYYDMNKRETQIKAENYRDAVHEMVDQINDRTKLKRIYQLTWELYKKER